jgi:hypothetical protein
VRRHFRSGSFERHALIQPLLFLFKVGVRFGQSSGDVSESGLLRIRESLLELFICTARIFQCLVHTIPFSRFRRPVFFVQLFQKGLECGLGCLGSFYERLKFCGLLAGGLHRHGLVEISQGILFIGPGRPV